MTWRTVAPSMVESIASADTANNTATDVVATGMSFTPDASSTYHVIVDVHYTVSASTVGIEFTIGDGAADNVGSGTTRLYARTSNTGITEVPFNGYQSPGSRTRVLGTFSSASGTTYARGESFFTTTASPADIGLYFRPEGGAGTVTVKTGSRIRWKKVA